MICETCHGLPGFPPCPECDGSGRTHCCEGERPMPHIASPECWCGPVQDTEEPNVWVHKI
jgi:hypothetical protein